MSKSNAGLVVVGVAVWGLSQGCSTQRADEHIGTVHQALTNNHTIEGYADRLSASANEIVGISVHVPAGSSNYSYKVKRYGPSDSVGNSVPSVITTGTGTTTQRSYASDSAVNGVSWPVTTTITVGSGWQGGIYAVELKDSQTNDLGYVTFVVKDSGATRKPRMLVASTNTWQAYNFWPMDSNVSPLSFYTLGACGCSFGTTAATTVSFLRPNPGAGPEPVLDPTCSQHCTGLAFTSEHLAPNEVRVAQWLEANAWTYSMITDTDLHNSLGDPNVLDPSVSPTLIISGHSEYWSDNMRQAVAQYLGAGGNLLSMSGNTMWWQVTLGGGQISKGQNPTQWTNTETSAVFGIAGTSTQDKCGHYNVTTAAHWTTTGLNVSSIGADGVEGHTAAPPSSAGYRRHCGSTTAGGAVGWETDRRWETPGFARTYNTVASSWDSSLLSNIVYMRKASAGQVVSAGSITFGQSLLWDGYQSSHPMTTMINRVLGRFAQRSFSDWTGFADGRGETDVLARDASGLLWRYNGHRGVPTGSLDARVQIGSGWGSFTALLAPGDFDGDGRSDLIARNPSGNLLLYRGDGAGGWASGSQGTVIGYGWDIFDWIVAPGDFDGDGNADLIADWGGAPYLYRGNGAGGWLQGGVGTSIGSGWNAFNLVIAPGDFNGDGNPDLLARKPNGDLLLYRGNGFGGWATGDQGWLVGLGWDTLTKVIPAGDFDGDGNADVLGVTSGGAVKLYRGTGFASCKPTGMPVTYPCFINETAPTLSTGWYAYTAAIGVW